MKYDADGPVIHDLKEGKIFSGINYTEQAARCIIMYDRAIKSRVGSFVDNFLLFYGLIELHTNLWLFDDGFCVIRLIVYLGGTNRVIESFGVGGPGSGRGEGGGGARGGEEGERRMGR